MAEDGVRERIEAQVATLARRVGRIEGDLRRTLDRDWTERATEVENDQVLEGLDEMILAELRELRGALRRIEDGTYGICAVCGGPIAGARLAALPATANCVRCAAGDAGGAP
ncbi:MAG: TraR/DksA family transcriptional regulator [Acidimicrobiia bacterium]|nr:TraR/DksA family transcriptional regulator [Acidimicrobiia bacterium]